MTPVAPDAEEPRRSPATGHPTQKGMAHMPETTIPDDRPTGPTGRPAAAVRATAPAPDLLDALDAVDRALAAAEEELAAAQVERNRYRNALQVYASGYVGSDLAAQALRPARGAGE